MTGPTFDIVCTTINDGAFLKHYGRAITEADARDRVRIIVIPDRKTPAALFEAVADARAQGFRVECPDVNEQEQFLASLGAPAGMFPFDTDHRRNVGYLMAWRDGADIMVSVDDDNLPQDGWLKDHAVVAQEPAECEVISASSGFWNPCFQLDMSPGRVYPRGYPYDHRLPIGEIDEAAYKWSSAAGVLAINQGLWLGDPDVDAITRLALHPSSAELGDDEVVLGADTWAPVNSQNSAIRREVIPAYYFFRSGRFGDIYQGYLAQACAKAMGHSVRFGTPVVRHERNDHDLLRDLQLELPDILILDGWLDWLTSAKPEGATYANCYAWLAEHMREFILTARDWPIQNRDTVARMFWEMQDWLTLIRKIGA